MSKWKNGVLFIGSETSMRGEVLGVGRLKISGSFLNILSSRCLLAGYPLEILSRQLDIRVCSTGERSRQHINSAARCF